jgi:hypothetical protein
MTTAMTITKRFILRGDYMTDGGLIASLRPRKIDIAIIGGKAHDGYGIISQPQIPLSDLRLTVDEHGYVNAGTGGFLPDEGEIDRIGRQYFTA